MKTWKFSLLTEQETQVDWWQFQEVATFTFTFCGTIESNNTILYVLLFNNILCSHWWNNRKFTLWLHRIPVLASTHIIFLSLMPNFATISPRFWSKYFTYFVPLWMCFELLSIQCFGSRLQGPPRGGEGGWRKTCGNDPLFRLPFVQTSTTATTKISLSTTATTNSCPRSLSSQIPPEELSWPLEAFQWKAAGNDFLANMYSAYFSVVCYHAPLHNFSFLPYSFSFFPPFWYFPPNFFSSSPIPSLSLSLSPPDLGSRLPSLWEGNGRDSLSLSLSSHGSRCYSFQLDLSYNKILPRNNTIHNTWV